MDKFKEGDFALCLTSYPYGDEKNLQFQKGKIYKIISVQDTLFEERYLQFEKDSTGKQNGWSEKFFKNLGNKNLKLVKLLYGVEND